MKTYSPPKALFAVFMLLVLALGAPANVLAKATPSIELQNGLLSASLKEVPLRVVFDDIRRQKAIWIKGDDSLLNKPVTAQFTGIKLEEGIKRLLGSVNHCLVYDARGSLTGINLIGAQSRESLPGKADGRTEADHDAKAAAAAFAAAHLKIVKNAVPPDNPNYQRIDVQVRHNATPPQSDSRTADDMAAFKAEHLQINKNAKLPGQS